MPSFKGRYGNGRRRDQPSKNFSHVKRLQSTGKQTSYSESTNTDGLEDTRKVEEALDEKFGFVRYEHGPKRVGWLINMHSTTVDTGVISKAAVNFYFLDDTGSSFKVTFPYQPYFLIATRVGKEAEVEEFLQRKFEVVRSLVRVVKDDLRAPNHLLGNRKTFVRIAFDNVNDLLAVRKALLPIIERNMRDLDAIDTYAEMLAANRPSLMQGESSEFSNTRRQDAASYIIDIREYDVPYHIRVAIDCDIRIGKWYTAEAKDGDVKLQEVPERISRADPVVMAFDIETTKLPLKFPDAAIDQIMMISFMVDGEGFLITNREIVSRDIDDFEYTPRPEYHGPFTVFNEDNEKELLLRFFEHVVEAKPTVIVTYNGDFFDWPFVEARALINGIDMYQEIGFAKDSEDEYKSTYCAHMDAFRWVKRDSYLPQGSQGLKAVTTVKLGYDPDELDPELMTPYAREQPQTLAEYSVSDAVATYYLYMKYVHPFIFSLCNIIPLNPDEVLRKGTGTLCEMLLMVQAYQKDIILPNKYVEVGGRFHDGHLLESETYVGGHVESLEAGVFRNDLPVDFSIDPTAIDELVHNLDAALKFTIEMEGRKDVNDILDYEEVKEEIVKRLVSLRDNPNRHEAPSIYHLDVASMYPNIMTSNRLQPDSMITEADCAACDFNRPGKTCDRRMPWSWRGEYFPAKADEYNMIKASLQNELYPGYHAHSPKRTWDDLSKSDQATFLKKRLSDYCRKVYHKMHETETVEREAIVCQRENPFYVDTVKSFRDRRYEYKGKQKVWKRNTEDLTNSGATSLQVDESRKMVVLYDSLQLAHKVILNSFYGYVMRKASRWYSMEMAGVTCLTGAKIIQMARQLVERIGRPLELDTDGIWCIFPQSFPENFSFTLANGQEFGISFPCVMLNHLVQQKFTNHQYQDLVNPKSFKYETHSENSIFFEVDGPYRAMILPASKEEDKNLKKRYAVFNQDGTIAELKGFEVKRRGELKLIKYFQTQIFQIFLQGSTLVGCYEAVAATANRWLQIVTNHGSKLADDELIDLISENRSMSRTLEDYGKQKSTSISTARRLAEFLGEQMVKDKGLACKFIISAKPIGTPVTDRAVPVAIFSSDESVKRHFLRKWLKDNNLSDFDPRNIIDWDYYKERLGSVLQKLIIIPAVMQGIDNPIPSVPIPTWLQQRISNQSDRFKQQHITDMFQPRGIHEIDINTLNRAPMRDIEDSVSSSSTAKSKMALIRKQKRKQNATEDLLENSASIPKVMPSMEDDYVAWLRYEKPKWELQRQTRERRQHLFGTASSNTTRGLATFFRDQSELLFTKSWQLIQLCETEIPGEIRAWILIDRNIHQIKLVVPKEFYLNMASDEVPYIQVSNCHIEKVHHKLPDGRSSAHLYRVTMPELTFHDNRAKVDSLIRELNVDGVYELNISARTRAMFRLGASCTFDDSLPGALGKALEEGFELHTLRRKHMSGNYLMGNPFVITFMYHVVVANKHLFALISSDKMQANVLILNNSKDSRGMPNMNQEYVAQLNHRKKQDSNELSGYFKYMDTVSFDVEQGNNVKSLHKKLSAHLRKLRSETSGARLVIVQSPESDSIEAEVEELRAFPVITMQPRRSDNSFPVLAWEETYMKRLMRRYLDCSAWLAERIRMARYSEIPLCELEGDAISYMIDVTYARRLQENDVVLWWSKAPIPDFGSYENDECLHASEPNCITPVNKPGTYTSVCVQVDVKNLSINGILTASIVNEAEGIENTLQDSTQSVLDNAPLSLMTSDAFSSASIMVFRHMVKDWWQDVCRGAAGPNLLVNHLLWWVGDTKSHLFAHSLDMYVQNISQKAFHQLLSEFKRVGADTVYACANKLVLHTAKFEVGNAHAYCQYILKRIQSLPLFHFLDLEATEYWDCLLWMDESNYGGKGCTEIVSAESQNLKVIGHWQIQSLLPAKLQIEFSDYVGQFVEFLHQSKATGQVADGFQRLTQIPREVNDEGQIQLVDGKYKKTLLKSISILLRQQVELGEDSGEFQFPPVPGLVTELENPVLQYAHALCSVLALTQDMSADVQALRRDIFGIFDIRVFSKAAAFKNPSESLLLCNQVCRHCNISSDLDFCRDEILITAGGDANSDGNAVRCAHCNAEFDRLGMEESMIGQLYREVTAYQVQDLVCSKCRRDKADNMREHCTCSGKWVARIDRASLVHKVKVYLKVSEFYNFRLLLALTENVQKIM